MGLSGKNPSFEGTVKLKLFRWSCLDAYACTLSLMFLSASQANGWTLKWQLSATRIQQQLLHTKFPTSSNEDTVDKGTPSELSNTENTNRWSPSPDLQRQIDAMREEWPEEDITGGVECTGEPRMDPSRQILQEDIENEEWF